MENDNGDRLCQWRWLALTPVALSVLLFSFLVFLPFFFFRDIKYLHQVSFFWRYFSKWGFKGYE